MAKNSIFDTPAKQFSATSTIPTTSNPSFQGSSSSMSKQDHSTDHSSGINLSMSQDVYDGDDGAWKKYEVDTSMVQFPEHDTSERAPLENVPEIVPYTRDDAIFSSALPRKHDFSTPKKSIFG